MLRHGSPIHSALSESGMRGLISAGRLWVALLAAFCCLATAEAVPDPPIVRATWLPVGYRCNTTAEIFSLFSQLQQSGVNRVYVDVYHRGQVFFRSKTMSALIGPDGYAGYDLLAWALKAGDAFQIQVIAWFEYGLMAEPNSVFGQWASAHGWTLGALHNVSWLDPRQPQVLGFLAGILADAWIGYSTLGLAAVQLDDHFASPAALPLSPNVTMVTVHDMNEAMRTYHVNWTVWLQQGWVSAVVPQLYRTTLGSFQAALNATMDVLLTTGVCSLMHAVGIRVDGSGPATNWSDVVGMWRTVRTQTADATGVSVWFAHGIAELYPTQFRCLWMDSGCS